MYSVTIGGVGLVELHLRAANTLVQAEARAVPTGSTLKRGIFYWQPGSRFLRRIHDATCASGRIHDSRACDDRAETLPDSITGSKSRCSYWRHCDNVSFKWPEGDLHLFEYLQNHTVTWGEPLR